jgi:hypothetical protein
MERHNYLSGHILEITVKPEDLNMEISVGGSKKYSKCRYQDLKYLDFPVNAYKELSFVYANNAIDGDGNVEEFPTTRLFISGLLK